MKKILGLTFGGLQQRILNLVLIFILAIVGVFVSVAVYQSKSLSDTVSEASDEQQRSINSVSNETMEAVVAASLTSSTGMQAYIADDTETTGNNWQSPPSSHWKVGNGKRELCKKEKHPYK